MKKIYFIIFLSLLTNFIIFFSLPLLYFFLNSPYKKETKRKPQEINLFQTKPIKTPKNKIIKIPPSLQKLPKTSPVSAIQRPFKLNLNVNQNNQGVSAISSKRSNIATYEIGQTDTDPQIIGNYPPPKTPARAKRELVNGQVVAQWIVNEFGRTVEVELLQEEPIGYGFGKKVIQYVQKLKFKPATIQKTPVRSLVKQKFNFQIR